MLDLITKGYIAAKLKIEDLIRDQRGVLAIEYVALAIGIIAVLTVVFKPDTSSGYAKALTDLFTRLGVKIGTIGS